VRKRREKTNEQNVLGLELGLGSGLGLVLGLCEKTKEE